MTVLMNLSEVGDGFRQEGMDELAKGTWQPKSASPSSRPWWDATSLERWPPS